MNNLLTPGQERPMNIRRAPVNGEPGAIVFALLVIRLVDGVSLVFTHHPILNKQFTNLDQARAYLQFLKDEAAAGTELWLIIERAGAWTSAQAAADQAEADMLDGIAANLDARTAQLDADTAREQAAVADIVNGPRTWNTLRQQYRPVRPTRTNTHLKPLTPAMRNLAAQHRDGVVRLPAGCDWRVLAGIADRGHGQVVEKRGYKVTAVRLNGRGFTAINQPQESAA